MRIFIHICIILLIAIARSVSAGVDIRLIVAGCNNDTVCEPVNGENYGTCPNDCTPAATTTPAVQQPAAYSGTTVLTSGPQLSNFTITYEEGSVILTWDTDMPTQSILKWGLTDDYSVGVVSEIVYVKKHTTKISNIISDTQYYFTVDAKDANGIRITYSGTFFLKKESGMSLPQNVESFQSYSTPTGIGLKWKNPDNINYSYVRILRSAKKFSLNSDDGKIVYEGRGQTVVDIDIADNTQYYYAIFLRDSENRYSSGVLLTATKYAKGKTPLDSDTAFPYGEYPITIIESTSTPELQTKDIDFIQKDTKLSFIGSYISVDANLPLIVSIPRRAGSVAFLTLSSSDQIYLVGINTKTNRLEAHIPSIRNEGKISYSIQIFKDEKFYQINNGILNAFISLDDKKRENDLSLAKKRSDWLMLIPIVVLLLAFKKFFYKNKKTELK